MTTFRVNIGEHVNIELVSTGHRCWGEIVGYKVGKYILIEPGSGYNRTTFLPEDIITVRCISGSGVLCGFRTTVAQCINDPFPQMILHYPKSVEEMQLRNESRYDCFCPVTLHYGERSIEGMVLNISEHGAKILLSLAAEEDKNVVIEDDTLVQIDVTPFGAVSPAVIEATVKRSHVRDGAVTLGVFFEQVAKQHELFEEFLGTCRKFGNIA